jgi:uncharacterized protein DUF6544
LEVLVMTDLGLSGAELRPRHRPTHGHRLFDRLGHELAMTGFPTGPGDETVVTEADIVGMPAAVQRYLRFMGTIGRSRDWSFRARFVGRFRMRPGMRWMPAEAWQYNSAIAVARAFVLRVRLAGLVPTVGKDVYVDGHGRMLGRLFGLITVADGKGNEFDMSELTTYLNDAVFLAPSFLLRPEVTWREVDADSFDVTLRDGGRGVSGRVFIDERGAPVDFSTSDRFADLPGGPRRAEWRTPMSEWVAVDGRPLPGQSKAVWNLTEGEFSYLEGRFDPASVAFNVAPTAREGGFDAR